MQSLPFLCRLVVLLRCGQFATKEALGGLCTEPFNCCGDVVLFFLTQFVEYGTRACRAFYLPIFVLLISILLLRQRIGPIRIVAVGIGFLGIILVLELDFMHLTWLSILPIFGGIFYAAGSVATRQLCEGESTLSMLLMLLCIQFTMGSVALYYISLTPAEVLPGWRIPAVDGFGPSMMQSGI